MKNHINVRRNPTRTPVRYQASSGEDGNIRPHACIRPSNGLGRSLDGVNRTDRLYAIVERLRATNQPVPARRLAEHFEVSTRTIERDLLALQESGVPIYAVSGRTGGYVLDSGRTLPPVNFTPEEATAIAVALGTEGATPLAHAARSALTKLLAAMTDEDRERAKRLDRRVHRYQPAQQSLSLIHI